MMKLRIRNWFFSMESGFVNYLLIGLGNPGAKYKNTRHNIGFMVVDKLAARNNASVFSRAGYYASSEIKIDDHRVMLVKPLTFMNRSGIAVASLAEQFGISLANVLVILDDFHIPFGNLRFRGRGSAGGHNGLVSVIAELGGEDFPRLRVGISVEHVTAPEEFVLSDFDMEEREALPEIIDHTVQGCWSFVTDGLTSTMNKFN